MSIRQGLMILVNATKEPAKQIITNAGDNADVVLNNVVKNFSEEFGYNPDIRKEVNLIESGIIDPTKVIRCALENAVSVVSLLLNTECVIAEEPEEKKEE